MTVTVTRGDDARGPWKKVLARLRPQMNKVGFATWLERSRALGYDPDGLLVVEVASRDAVENLNRSLYSLTQRTLMKVTGAPADIQFICSEQVHVKETPLPRVPTGLRRMKDAQTQRAAVPAELQ